MDLGQKFFRQIDLFDFTSFFGLDFFKFSLNCDEILPFVLMKVLYDSVLSWTLAKLKTSEHNPLIKFWWELVQSLVV